MEVLRVFSSPRQVLEIPLAAIEIFYSSEQSEEYFLAKRPQGVLPPKEYFCLVDLLVYDLYG